MRNIIRRVFFVVAAATIAGSSLGLALPQLTQKALAAGCSAPSIMFGRWRWCGYFYNRWEDPGPQVRLAGVPGWVNTVGSFYNLIWDDYNSGDPQKITSSVFVVRTMIGEPLPWPPCALGTCKTLTPEQWFEFGTRLNGYASSGENGIQSFGPNGHIDWFHSDYMHCGDFNTYYQVGFQDIAPYIINGSNTPECNNSGIQFDHIFFYDTSGNPIYRIRRPCMNPLGTLQPLAPLPPQYNLTPNISVSQSGGPLPNGSYVDAGSSVTFSYSVDNSLSGTATGIACDMYANTFSGFHAIPSPADASGPPPVGPTCTDTFGPGNTDLGSETVNNLPANSSICRSLYVDPSEPSGGPLGYESCIYVTAKPYFRAYGGDISAGNAQPGACSTAVNAAIVGWNKESGGGYGGAGVQFAAYALDVIYDTATNLGNAAGSVVAPTGLSFANTTASGTSNFGGSFGGVGALPCIADYYGTPSGTPLPAIHPISALNGVYTATGPVTFSTSVMGPGQKAQVFVNGNVIINGNLTYGGAWSVGQIPMFELIVKGNIYISNAVTRLDGIYIAQGGTIYTCATGSTPVAPTSAGYYSACNNNLVVNGSFVAQQVQLLRTKGSLGGSSAGELNTSTNIGEIFNYGPAFWIPQPATGPTTTDYDAITSMPPIL